MTLSDLIVMGFHRQLFEQLYNIWHDLNWA